MRRTIALLFLATALSILAGHALGKRYDACRHSVGMSAHSACHVRSARHYDFFTFPPSPPAAAAR